MLLVLYIWIIIEPWLLQSVILVLYVCLRRQTSIFHHTSLKPKSNIVDSLDSLTQIKYFITQFLFYLLMLWNLMHCASPVNFISSSKNSSTECCHDRWLAIWDWFVASVVWLGLNVVRSGVSIFHHAYLLMAFRLKVEIPSIPYARKLYLIRELCFLICLWYSHENLEEYCRFLMSIQTKWKSWSLK